ncbi:MAG: hypothetical protein F9K44_06445 [Hyphomicrobiaceae bacterium]|nr:MAG: hypothetical protein F9K44_06445 [Hyphomicrobiaceae bacterium]
MKKIVLSLVAAAGMGLFAAGSMAAPTQSTPIATSPSATQVGHKHCHVWYCRYSHHHHKKICYWVNRCH